MSGQGHEGFPELERFLDAEGRLTRWPAKRRARVPAMRYLVSRFAAGREYSEREVNELLDRWHTFGDAATLRRTLFDEHYLDRTADGSRYWLSRERC